MDKDHLSSEYVKAYYEKAVGKFSGSYANFRWFHSDIPSFSREEYKQTRRTILNALKEKTYESVLEIGGGDGVWTELLLDRSGLITELDISEDMLQAAKKKFEARRDIKFIQGDFLENNLPSDEYDLLYTIRCFEYFSDKRRAITEMYRLLKGGGELLIVTKNPYYIRFKGGEKKLLHQGQISSQDLKNLLVSAGFILQDIKPAILGKKFDIMPARMLFGALHAVSLSRASFLVPGIIKKYFSESYLVAAQKP